MPSNPIEELIETCARFSNDRDLDPLVRDTFAEATDTLRTQEDRIATLERALRKAADAMTCRRDDDAHYCPNCDNSLYDEREAARSALEGDRS